MDTKKPWQSKTIIVNFVAAAGALFFPPFTQWISAHPAEIASAFSILNIVLRVITKDKIAIAE